MVLVVGNALAAPLPADPSRGLHTGGLPSAEPPKRSFVRKKLRAVAPSTRDQSSSQAKTGD